MRRIVKINEASAYIGIGKSTLYLMSQRGEIPHLRIGIKSVRFDLDLLDAWLKEQEAGPKVTDGSRRAG